MYIYIYYNIYVYISICVYNEMSVVKGSVELFCNLRLLLVNSATSSDCYKCELMSVLIALYSCNSSHYLTSCFQNMLNKL